MEGPLPFNDAGNPVMAQVAFLTAMVSPKIAAAAAQRALEVTMLTIGMSSAHSPVNGSSQSTEGLHAGISAVTATTELHDAKLEAACVTQPTRRHQLPQVLAEEDPALAEEAARDGAVQHAAAAAAGGGVAAANGGPAAHPPVNGAIGAGRMRVAAAAALVGVWPPVLTAYRHCASACTHRAALMTMNPGMTADATVFNVIIII